MRKKLFLYCLLCVIPFVLNAQKISVLLPQQANKEYAFVLSKGIAEDTIQKGILPFNGKIIIDIPQKDKDYIGMGALQIKDNSPISLIVNHENFEMEQSVDGKYKFKKSRENEYLYSIMQERVFPEQDTTLYASHFINLIRYTQQLEKMTSQGAGLMEKANTRLYAVNQLDMEYLYTSSVWYNTIDGLVRMSPGQHMFGEDMVRILKRIKSQEVFEHLAENLVTITEQYGWDDAFDIIVPYVQESGRIEVPKGKMFNAFSLAKIRKGTLAPPLKGLVPSLSNSGALKTLLVFYQPDCENCHTQIEQLIQNYPKLKEQGVRIVSISSDRNTKTFDEDVSRFPWPNTDKLCDFKGFAGDNFIDYGIMGTPTFFLLDSESKIIKRYALYTEINF